MEGVMGVVTSFAINYEPKYWAFCNGQQMSISTNTALFSLLGTNFGGDGVNYFNLPDLRGRAPVGTGNGAGLTPCILGQKNGAEAITLTVENLPSHSHNGNVALNLMADNTGSGGGTSPDFSFPGLLTNAYGGNPDVTMANPTYSAFSIGTAGAGAPVNTRSPYVAVNFVICVTGIFPSRS